MAEAHAEHRRLVRRSNESNDVNTPASSGRPGPGDRMTASGAPRHERLRGLRVGLHDLRRPAEALDELDQVVRERVVVIDDQDHAGSSSSLGPSRERTVARRDRGQERRGLRLGLAELALGVGVRDHAGARLHRHATVDDDGRPDRDAEVQIAREREVADRAGVRAARGGLVLGDQLHRPALRRAGHRSRRERHRQRVQRMELFAELALHGRDDMHHLREPLDLHQLGRPDRAGDADATEVVAGEVDQHRVLRLLLRVGEQLVLQEPVADLGLTPRARAGDRAGGDAPALDADERLGRRAGQLHPEHPHEEHVRGGVRHAEAAVDREAAVRCGERHPPRGHALVDVPGQDVLLERRHRPPVALVGHVRFSGVEGSLRRDRRRQRRRLGRRDPGREVVDRADAVVVPARRDVRDQDEPLPPVVEHHGAVDHEQSDRRTRRVVRLGCRVSVEEVRRLVREVAHQAADQGREVGEPGAGERTCDRDQRLPRFGVGGQGHRRERPHDVLDPHAVAVDDHGRRGVARHERVPAPPLRALDGLEDQAGAVARHGGEQPDGRGDVGQQLRPHGDQRPLGRERVELVTTGPHLQMRFHVRSFWSIPSDPCADRRRGNGGTPDRRPGAAGARGASAGPTDAPA